MTSDELALVIQDLLDHEGCESRLYLDTRGHPTVGIGELVSSETVAATMPFWNETEHRPARKVEIIAEFHRVSQIGQRSEDPFPAWHYFPKEPPLLGITIEMCKERCRTRLLEEFVPTLRMWWKGFEEYPTDAKRVLCDLAWNVGVHSITNYVKLMDECALANWLFAAEECDTNRPDRTKPRKRRNQWRHDLMAGCSQPLAVA